MVNVFANTERWAEPGVTLGTPQVPVACGDVQCPVPWDLPQP